jgi:peptide/nickel transport system ATP-binding protein
MTELPPAQLMQVDHLTRHFKIGGALSRRTLHAVDDVSFAIGEQEIVALVGESGSGKSTVVRALSRLVRPSGGQILLDGRLAGRFGTRAYRRRVQMVFQDPFASLNPAHDVDHHLRRPLLIHRHAGADAGEAVRSLLRSVNLLPAEDIAVKRPHELSGGQRQRVAIARALAPDPDFLLADEPVSMLDVSIRLEILNLLDRLKDERGLGMLYVTHDLATARHFSSDIMVLYQGEIVERGPSDEVILRPSHPYTQLLAASTPAGSRRALGEPPPASHAKIARTAAERREIVVGSGCRFRARCPYAMDICATHPPETAVGGGHQARCWLHSDRPEAVAQQSARSARTAPEAGTERRPTP